MEKEITKPGVLALADGTVIHGTCFGALRGPDEAVSGEVVFNTSMYGYQEILTDPSYSNQIMCFTYPQIGNVGCNPQDDESDQVHVEGIILRNLSPIVSNYRATESLSNYLRRAGKMGISGIDTRDIVTLLRENGSQMGVMACGDKLNTSDLVDLARSKGSMEGQDLVPVVSCKQPYVWRELPWSHKLQGFRTLAEEEIYSRPHVVAVDTGVKRNILRLLVDAGFRVTVVPARSTSAEMLKLSPDALFLSNGPGDPATLSYIVQPVKELLGKLPMFGICLGHQILAQALGGKTYKLKYGHRGGNHPVMDLGTRKVEITVQNHGFAVDADTLKGKATISHVNLNDGTVEGLEAPEYKAFCIQYHPEASPGPHDSRYLFKRFFENVVGYQGRA